MEGKKRKIQSILDDDTSGYKDKVYKFQVLLPNGISVMIVKRSPLSDMPLERFLEKVREKSLILLRETEHSKKQRRKVCWDSKELYLEDALGKKIKFRLCFDEFQPNKIHYLRLYDGVDQAVDSFENMWDLTPDTDLLTELPEDYTFETALADLIDNALQAVWSNGERERKLISIEVHDDKVSVFDTGPGMDATEENSIVKWGKMGASVHRSSKKLAIGGTPPYLTPFFGMFGYGGTIASMHLGRHAIVSAKTKESKKVYRLHLERDALLKRSGSSSNLSWKAAGGIRDPTRNEIEKSPHNSFTKIDLKPKLKIPNIFQLQCKLKDIYFPYIQCDEIAKEGRTTTLVEFEVNGINLAEIDGGEIAITNLHSCNGPDFVLNLHFSIQDDNSATKCPSAKASREANLRLKCVYFPVVEGKESIDRILEKLKSDGFVIKEDFETFSRISIRRLGRLLPDARWDLLPFMKPKQKRGDKLQILKRCCWRVKCFIETDAGFNPIPSKTDLAPQHPFTKALKDLGSDSLHKEKEVEVRIYRNERKITLAQLEKEYQEWILQMHSQYDDEFNCGDDEPILLVSASNKEALGIKCDVVRVHQAISRKGRSWRSGQRVKIFKGAGPGCHKSNMYVTLEYFLLEGLQGDVGGEARVICRPLGVPDDDGCKLKVDAMSTHMELHSSISLPIVVIDSGKCVPVGVEDWNCQAEKLHMKMPSTIDVLGLKQCQELDIDGALATEAPVSAGSIPPREVVAVLRPANFSSSSVSDDLDQKYIIRDNYEMCMDINFKADGAKTSKLAHIFSGIARNASRKGIHGLYIFDLGTDLQLFQKAGVYSFSFSLKNSACRGCEVSVHVKPSSTIKRWELMRDDQLPPFSVRAGSCFRPFSVARFDMYDNCVPFKSIPEIAFQLRSKDVVLCHSKKVKVELSSDNYHMIVRDVHIKPNNIDEIRPGYEATLTLSQRDKVPILSIPCQVFPGPLKSVTFHMSESGNGLLPKQVILDAKLEMFDRHGNHVKEGTMVELTLHGFCFLDQIGIKREADKHGCVDLSGVLKVTEAYGELVLYEKTVILTRKWQVEKRELIIATDVPEICHAGSTLEDVAFEVIDSKGQVDQFIHDDDKHGQSHTLKITTDLPNIDSSLRYTFRHGRCVIPSIALPKREGSFYIEAAHSHHQELHLKFKINISPPMENDTTADRQVSREAAVPQSQNKKSSVLSPVRTPIKEQGETMFQVSDGTVMLHPDIYDLDDASKSMRSKVQDKQTTPVGTPLLKQSDSNVEPNNDIFQSPEGKIMSLDSCTPQPVATIKEPYFWDLQDVEKEIYNYGLEIKEYEEDLRDLQLIKEATVLQLQASMELQPLDQSDYESRKEVLLEYVGNKVGSAAAVYNVIARNLSLTEHQPKTTANLVGVVAFLAMAPSHILSCLLAQYLGEDQMLAIVCQSSVKNSEEYERVLNSLAAELGKDIKGSFQLICLDDIRPYAGDIDTSDPQRRLSLPRPKLPDGTTPKGFLGHALNMIEIHVDHLQTKTAAGYGLRETLFYRLFGELQVYDRKNHMTKALDCIKKDGAVSLDGGIIRGNGIISFGCKEVDVQFPVADVEHRLIVSPKSTEIMSLVEKKNAAQEAIDYTCKKRSICMKQFQERKAGFLKLVEEKELHFSQESLKPSPMASQTSGH